MNKNTVNYIIHNYLYNSKNKINTKRLNKEYFNKNNLEYLDIFQDQEKLFNYLKENNLLLKELQEANGEDPKERYYNKNTCKYCDNYTEFIDVNKGYKKFCNLSCSAKFNTKGKNKGVRKNREPISFKKLVIDYLLSTNNGRTIIETQRLNEKYFKKNRLEIEYYTYKNILLDKEKLQNEIIKSNLYILLFRTNPNTQEKNTCLNCFKETKFISISKGYKKYCSRSCAAKFSLNLEKQKETMLKKYNVENAFQIQTTRDKIDYEKVQETLKKTNLERYGVEHVFSSKIFREKSKKTKLERYGDEYFTNTQKQKQWYMDNYGVEWNSKVPAIKEKQNESLKKQNFIFNENGLNYWHQNVENRKEDIDENGLNSYERTTKYRKEDIDENGLNSFERVTKQRTEDIDENGLNSFERVTKQRTEDIDENGLNSYERIAKYRKEDIDENGLNSYERAGIKGNIKRRITNEEKGNWITEEKIKDFKDYSKLVWRYTRQQPLQELDNIENRGTGTHEFHLDHKYSIFQGYMDNIPAEIIGNINNLEMLVSRVNMSKNISCSITKGELLSPFK